MPVDRFKMTLWLMVYVTVLAWSANAPRDYFTWWLEVLPALIALAVLAFTLRRFPLTPLVYLLILIHSIILMVGGHYTYAEVPLFEWLKDSLDMERNNYDKLGHFAQGFVPAMVAREILIRRHVLEPGAWMNLFVISFILAFSAFYELIEWAVAIMTGEDAEAFLGTQGYEWDTQTDMAMALLGGISALLLLGGIHSRQIEHLQRRIRRESIE